MKKPNVVWNNLKNTIYEKYGRESGKMLVHAGLITWTAATLSQVFAIALNNKLTSNEKKFLIPQEISDGVLNILTFYLFTNTLKNISGKLVSTGKWSTKGIRDFVTKNQLTPNIKMGDLETNLGATFKENKEFHDCYDKFKGGVDMIAATTGSIASCNIVTPFIRNKIGANEQKQSIERDKTANLTPPVKISMGNLKI